MTENRNERVTIRQWLAEHARERHVHYTEIASALGRDPASVSASLSIEGRQARDDARPPYFVRVAPGLYRYNDICEGAVDEDSISEVSARAKEFNMVTRMEITKAIADLDLVAFEKLAKIILLNARVRVEDIVVHEHYNGTVVMSTGWVDDSGGSPVVILAMKCELDEEIDVDNIRKLRGLLPILGANQGVLVSNGIVTVDARNEALGYTINGDKMVKNAVQPIHIMDKDVLLNILFESRTGIRSRSVEVFLIDNDFFERLQI
ncbi:MAG: restriction endonuclease [Candidatus Thorarchaeota archaeon]